jgi:DNA segregation ATPase FtsK/SpoIIIE, S-DNA-T family
LAVPMAWVVMLFKHQPMHRPLLTILFWLVSSFAAATALATIPPPQNWALTGGFGGSFGDVIARTFAQVLSLGIKGFFAYVLIFGGCAGLSVWAALRAMNLTKAQSASTLGIALDRSKNWSSSLMRAVQQLVLRRREKTPSSPVPRLKKSPSLGKAPSSNDILTRLAPGRTVSGKSGGRVEPMLLAKKPASQAVPEQVLPEEDDYDDEVDATMDEDFEEPMDEPFEDESATSEDEAPVQISRSTKEIKPSKKLQSDLQPGFKFAKPQAFEMPPLTLLAEPKKPTRSAQISNEVLEQNARMLEGVLEDFGVRGQIINVKPGPVVTLYELEPAPGIKSSRVISLADDIARSMSAISARVAVVQGRNVIGIELPNAKRETVYLRELLGSEAFEKTTQNLAMALGKTIGGEPIFADLARMPHLLIAGTTGSGKSVGINTMILSLLYRLSPERCKLIMIDPKMLELSVYEGIPHLLAPVVTDPRKAVVALKWAVREMEDRYRKMSKLGVRNIDGFNARVQQSTAKGQKMSRTVQTGFNPQSGEPIFEQEDMDLKPLPYIVVIIDEMADLMMVAGKDIEGAVQRLAQMARAAGIHVVMATQRPSVDVITGTIKANFPTRISFQVTSKIDSRTILGEQGAEQLLGQGDMLYMAGGGRISRLHGPFVADDEVEKIVSFLKTQGQPEYIDAVTEEADEEAYGDPAAALAEGGGSGDDLYDQAVAVVLRDKKVSTSYVQRRLQVGYNKAASLIERMEKEGLISAANATGKREILVPGDSARD